MYLSSFYSINDLLKNISIFTYIYIYIYLYLPISISIYPYLYLYIEHLIVENEALHEKWSTLPKDSSTKNASGTCLPSGNDGSFIKYLNYLYIYILLDI